MTAGHPLIDFKMSYVDADIGFSRHLKLSTAQMYGKSYEEGEYIFFWKI